MGKICCQIEIRVCRKINRNLLGEKIMAEKIMDEEYLNLEVQGIEN